MRIGVLTSGGDSPGMNACIRAIVRIGCKQRFQVYGIVGGYQGILDEAYISLDARSVAKIIHRGGTILTTGRSEEFKTKAGLENATENLKKKGINALIAVGGDGTMRGLYELGKRWKDGLLIGVPGTIDNDVFGTDHSIGFDTAVNNALVAIDKIRDTAEAFSRVFLIEVMGRHSGAIAAHVGIASGASAIIIPETPTNLDELAQIIIEERRKGKMSSIIIVAEGDEAGDATAIASKLTDKVEEGCRVSILGYIQRGGNPTHCDRILATRLGAYAIDCILEGKTGIMVGESGRDLVETPFEDTWKKKKHIEEWMLERITDLSS